MNLGVSQVEVEEVTVGEIEQNEVETAQICAGARGRDHRFDG